MLHVIPILAVLFYVFATFGYLRVLVRSSDKTAADARRLFFLGFLFHAGFVVLASAGLFGDASARENAKEVSVTFAFSASLMSLFLSAMYLIFERRMKLEVLGAFVSPVTIFFMLFSSVAFHLEQDKAAVQPTGLLLWAHIGCALLANVAFVMSFAASGALVIQERMLKRRRFTWVQQRLPSLTALDRMNSRLLIWGVVLMSLAVAIGFTYAVQNNVSFFRTDPRLIWTSFVLVIYAGVLTARFRFGIRGRRVGWFSIAGFALLVASYFGVHVFSNSFHVH